jgi:hypothetical protein
MAELSGELEKIKNQLKDFGNEYEVGIVKLEAYIEKLTESSESIQKNAEEIVRAKKLLNDYTEAANKSSSSVDRFTKSIAGALGINANFDDSLLGTIASFGKMEGASDALAESFSKTFTAANIGASVLAKVAETTALLTYTTDEAIASFNVSTGAAFLSGVTAGDAAAAFAAMSTNITNLKNISPSSRRDISETVAILNEMGVNADTTTSNIQFMQKSLGLAVSESTGYQRELFVLAQEIGMPPAEMAENFRSAAPQLAAFGKSAGKVFKDLQLAARASGLEVQELLNIVGQFDTFEGAAESVGKLNAILGGPFLNSMEMVMETDPTRRMQMLSDALNNAGRSFDDMTYYERKAIAAAAGLDDVNQLALVMAGNFEGAGIEVNKSASEIQEMANRQKEFSSITQDLTEIMMSFAMSVRPVITFVKELLSATENIISSFNETGEAITGAERSFGSLMTTLGAGFIGIAAGAGIISGLGTVIFSIGSAIVTGTVGLAASILGIGTAAATGGAAASVGAAGMLAFGAAVLGIGAGIALVISSLAKLKESFAANPAEEMANAFKGMDSKIFESIESVANTSTIESLKMLTAEIDNMAIALKKIDEVENLKAIAEMSKTRGAANLIMRANVTQTPANNMTPMNPTQQSVPSQINVTLQLDGRELGNKVISLVDNK